MYFLLPQTYILPFRGKTANPADLCKKSSISPRIFGDYENKYSIYEEKFIIPQVRVQMRIFF